MLIYLHYDEGSDESVHVTLKFTVPKSWYDKGCGEIVDSFVEYYNEKMKKKLTQEKIEGEEGLETDLEKVTLEAEKLSLPRESTCLYNRTRGIWLDDKDRIRDSMERKHDLHLKPLADKPEVSSLPLPPPSSLSSSSFEVSQTDEVGDSDKKGKKNKEGKFQCQNFGCNMWFIDDDLNNTISSCKHHVGPPVFHDCKKGWSCCKKRVYDWDEFALIEGCHVGKHSKEKLDGKLIANSPNYVDNSSTVNNNTNDKSSNGNGGVQLKSIDDFNKANPNAISATNEIEKTKQKLTQSTRKADGTATCLNKGCQKDFIVAENNPQACTYHSKEPVFHDVSKFWSCCPQNVKYDFDSFLAIPGCTVGWHNDGHQTGQEAK